MKNLKVMFLALITVVSFFFTVNASALETIKVRVVDDLTNADFSYLIEPGLSLNELKEKKFASKLKTVIDNPEHKYRTFINLQTGKAVDFNEKLYSDITIKAISAEDTITITIANTGNSFSSLDAGITINDLKALPYGSQVENLINDENKKFAMFIDEKTKEEIKLDEPIYVNTTIRAIYYITVTIDGVDHEVLETARLEDLYQFAAKKEGYQFAGFVDEKGNPATDASVVDKAVLTSTYTLMNVENPQTSDFIFGYFGLALISFLTILYVYKTQKA